MTAYYVDSSALVKAYVDEPGSEWTRLLVRSEAVVGSALVLTEVASAIGRRTRDGTLPAQLAGLLFEQFLHDASAFDLIPVTQGILVAAADLLLGTGGRLRTLDALHLASAQASFGLIRSSGLSGSVFVSADLRLLEAARAGGLAVENPEEHP